MMISTSKLLLISTLLSLFLLQISISKVGASDEDTAALAINRAEETMASAHEAVLEAERVRANVSRLLDQLNAAGEHLAKAHILYRLGDFDGAAHSADLSSEMGEEVRNEAMQLKIEAYRSWITDLWIRMIVSFVGVAAVIFGSFMAWSVFKRRYFRAKTG